MSAAKTQFEIVAQAIDEEQAGRGSPVTVVHELVKLQRMVFDMERELDAYRAADRDRKSG